MTCKSTGIGLATALSVLLLGPVAAQQQSQTPAIDVEKLGPQVGATVPDFSLPDQHGVTRSLKSVMGPKGAILVFFRSADW
jgi:cytochrome oxidase Cu insertion factor (SCO1/SenC/PrrC family)